MTLETFYLICFVTGFVLSFISFAGQGMHFHVHRGPVHARGGGGRFNFMTLTAFLAWFGGAGYLLLRYTSFWVWMAFGLAMLAGLAGAAVIFWTLGGLLARERQLNDDDYRMVGVLGRVSSTTLPNGVGEMIFSQEGSRRAAAIRAEDSQHLERGTEVIVTRFEKGIAYVRRWDDAISSL